MSIMFKNTYVTFVWKPIYYLIVTDMLSWKLERFIDKSQNVLEKQQKKIATYK